MQGQSRLVQVTAIPAAGGRSRVLEFRIRPECLEIWDDGRHAGLIDRDAVRLWLAAPQTPLTIDDVALAWNGLTLVLCTLRGEFDLPSRVEAALREEPTVDPRPAGLALRRRPPPIAPKHGASPALQ